MKKITLVTSSWLIGALLLAGAGCAQNQSLNNQTNPPATTTATDTQSASNDFVIKVNPADYNYVYITWIKSADMATSSVIRLMHSSADNPTFPVPANGREPYWYQPDPAKNDLMWSGIPVGTRYFRACEYKDNKCLRHSNIVKFEAK